MDHPKTGSKPRRDGWTPERRETFLHFLGMGIDVRRACAGVGLSREAAYKLRRRDARFAREWQSALRTARICADERFLATLSDGLLEIIAGQPAVCELRKARLISQDSVRCVASV